MVVVAVELPHRATTIHSGEQPNLCCTGDMRSSPLKSLDAASQLVPLCVVSKYDGLLSCPAKRSQYMWAVRCFMCFLRRKSLIVYGVQGHTGGQGLRLPLLREHLRLCQSLLYHDYLLVHLCCYRLLVLRGYSGLLVAQKDEGLSSPG